MFVGNIDQTTTVKDLHDLFSQFGEITSIKIPDNQDGKSREIYGFVNFRDHNSAVNAESQMNKKVLPSGKIIIVNKHISRQ